MGQFAVLKAFNLASAPVDIADCFGLEHAPDQAPSFTSMVRVGFATQSVAGADECGPREINMSQYQLYRWLLDHGADDGETVLVCWSPAADVALRTTNS